MHRDCWVLPLLSLKPTHNREFVTGQREPMGLCGRHTKGDLINNLC